MELSPSGNIVIEKYLGECTKFDVYYIIQHGIPVLVSSNDTVMCPRIKKQEILQAAWTFPSHNEEIYKQKLDGSVKDMLQGLGIYNGYITISGFVDDKSNMYIFETGFRLSGDFSFKYTERALGYNYIDMLIEQALYGDVSLIDCTYKKNSTYLLVVNYYVKDGVAAKIRKSDKLKVSPNVELVECRYGNEFNSYGGLLRKSAMLFCYGNSVDKTRNCYNDFYDAYDIEDVDGKSMIYFKPEVWSLF